MRWWSAGAAIIVALSGDVEAQTATSRLTVADMFRSQRIHALRFNDRGDTIRFSVDSVDLAGDSTITRRMSVAVRAPFAVRIEPGGEREQRVSSPLSIQHPDSILAQYPAPGGALVAFVSRADPRIDIDSLRMAGIPHDQNTFYSAYVAAPGSVIRTLLGTVPPELWIYDRRTAHTRFIWRPGAQGIRSHITAAIERVAWSPSGSHFLMVVRDRSLYVIERGAHSHLRFYVFEASSDVPIFASDTTGQYESVSPTWTPDGKAIEFSTYRLAPGRAAIGGTRTVYRAEESGRTHRWRLDNGLVEVMRSPTVSEGMTLPNGRSVVMRTDPLTRTAGVWVGAGDKELQRIGDPTLSLSGCALVPTKERLACVGESVNDPPEVVLVDLPSGRTTRITRLNVSIAALGLSRVEPVDWVNEYGHRTRNYLVLPRGYRKGTGYPLLVVLYNFNNQFALDDQWIHSFPVQLLADRGFAVLLTNLPDIDTKQRRDSGLVAIAHSPLSSVVTGVKRMIEEGIADSARVGIMGFSYGGFVTQFAVTQVPSMFAAAMVNDGGPYNPAAYWIGGAADRLVYDDLFGGSPFKEGPSAAAWRSIAPALNASAIRAPVLFEQHDPGDEIRARLVDIVSEVACSGKAYDFIQYFDAKHVLQRPPQRRSSMDRTADWFAFWLQGVEDTTPAKREQYLRWRKQRQKLDSGNSSVGVERATCHD